MSERLSDDPSHAVPAASRLRASRRRWRVFAFFALAIAVVAAAGRFGPGFGTREAEHIARITIDGTISHNQQRLEAIRAVAKDPKVAAVLVAINSPGGSSAGGEELYEALNRLRQKKPVVAVVSELGASAAYMTAIATDRIFARHMSMVGSIGVYIQHVNAGKLMNTIGVSLDKIASGPLKGEPDLSGPIKPDVRASLEKLITDSYNQFVDMVAKRRDLPRDKVLALADGGIYSGQRALDDKLIDAIGGQTEAIDWLQQNKGIKPDLPVRTVYPLPPTGLAGLERYLRNQAKSVLGLDSSNPMTLDGLVSLWHLDSAS